MLIISAVATKMRPSPLARGPRRSIPGGINGVLRGALPQREEHVSDRTAEQTEQRRHAEPAVISCADESVDDGSGRKRDQQCSWDIQSAARAGEPRG